jgi:hypothetical protein
MQILKTTRVLIPLLLLVMAGAAGAANKLSYVEAYNLCSPVAHQIARQQCDFGRVYEHYYQYCMKQGGYSDEDGGESPDYYKGYMKAYKGCSSTADHHTKDYCGYGNLYNAQYNKCMIKNGFDSNGDAAASATSGIQEEKTEKHFQFDY